MNRAKNLAALSDEFFDLVIVGGGITGACLALDASSRGMKTALIEKNDFGHATSASSSKLLHGGIRYLQEFRFDKVRESALERVYFQNLVPHLCEYVPFVIPTFAGVKKGKLFLGSAARAYQALTLGQNLKVRFNKSKVESPRIISRNELAGLIPWVDESWAATGGLVLPEAHMQSSERVTLAIVKAAVGYGCVAANYVEAKAVEQKLGEVTGVKVRHGDDHVYIKTRAVANCGGPWLSEIDESAVQSQSNTITSFSRGSHLVLKGLNLKCALALPTTQKIRGMADRGGRHIFLIPWRDHVLLGTSYAEHEGNLDHVVATDEDQHQLLEAVNDALGANVISESNIAHTYAGIYPLTTTKVQADVYQGASDYVITNHGNSGGPNGFFSLFGAKYTTARKLAEVGCNAIESFLGKPFKSCQTRSMTVPEADVDNLEDYPDKASKRYNFDVEPNTLHHLFANYGTQIDTIFKIVAERPELLMQLGADRVNIEAEVIYSARHEMVEHLTDFIFRRTGIGTIGDPGAGVVHKCAELLARELNWTPSRTEHEISQVKVQINNGRAK